nr:unnamed protein product [Rangifer tarandus platyrhynchus]
MGLREPLGGECRSRGRPAWRHVEGRTRSPYLPVHCSHLAVPELHVLPQSSDLDEGVYDLRASTMAEQPKDQGHPGHEASSRPRSGRPATCGGCGLAPGRAAAKGETRKKEKDKDHGREGPWRAGKESCETAGPGEPARWPPRGTLKQDAATLRPARALGPGARLRRSPGQRASWTQGSQARQLTDQKGHRKESARLSQLCELCVLVSRALPTVPPLTQRQGPKGGLPGERKPRWAPRCDTGFPFAADTALRPGCVKPQSARGAHTGLLPAGDGTLRPDLRYPPQERKPASRLHRERGPDGGCGETEPTEKRNRTAVWTARRPGLSQGLRGVGSRAETDCNGQKRAGLQRRGPGETGSYLASAPPAGRGAELRLSVRPRAARGPRGRRAPTGRSGPGRRPERLHGSLGARQPPSAAVPLQPRLSFARYTPSWRKRMDSTLMAVLPVRS